MCNKSMNENAKYAQRIDEILAIPRYKKKTNQAAIAKLLSELGNPEQEFQIIHVAGTNGKGSICATIEQIGRDLGYKMGMFTSPHLLDIRERFMVNHQLMEPDEFIYCYEEVVAAKERCYQQGEAPYTFFETIFAIGMVYFKQQKVEYAVVEAGMGGKSDTTNVVNPVATVIASVGLDHTAVLGDTLEAIAKEKSGIMKAGATAFVARQDVSILPIFRDYSQKLGVECHFMQDYEVRILKNDLQGIDFSVICEYDKKGQNCLQDTENEASLFHTSLVGDYQVDNILTGMIVAKHLWGNDCDDFVDQLRTSVAKVRWPGRMERVAKDVYVDGAHNGHAISGFVRNVKQYVAKDSLVLLYAVASDKDDRTMLQELLTLEPSVLLITELSNGRKTSCEEVFDLAQSIIKEWGYQTEVVVCSDAISDAISQAMSYGKTLFCVGSLYLVSDVKAYFNIELEEDGVC